MAGWRSEATRRNVFALLHSKFLENRRSLNFTFPRHERKKNLFFPLSRLHYTPTASPSLALILLLFSRHSTVGKELQYMTHWKVSEFQLYCLVIKARCLTRSINVNISNERWMEEKKNYRCRLWWSYTHLSSCDAHIRSTIIGRTLPPRKCPSYFMKKKTFPSYVFSRLGEAVCRCVWAGGVQETVV